MTQQEREEIERILHGIMDAQRGLSISSFNESYLKPLMSFARQQLNLRVDGQRFMERFIDSNLICPQCAESDEHGIVIVWSSCAPEQLEALVLECLTTDPLPTGQTPM